MDFGTFFLSHIPQIAGIVIVFVLIYALKSSSAVVYIKNTQYGIVERKWAVWNSPEVFGLIALRHNPGFVPEVLRGGWHLLTPYQYKVHKRDLIKIDQIAYLIARVGAPLAEGQVLAAWPDAVSVEDASPSLRGVARRASRDIF